jgi:DNA-binding PucR family transcriptional regulator
VGILNSASPTDAPRGAREAEIEYLRTAVEVTNTLLTAISAPEPERALTARLSALIQGTAIIYDIEGTVIASTGEAPARLIWNEVAGTHRNDLETNIGRWSVHSRRVTLRDGNHVIALAARSADMIERRGALLLDTAERLFTALDGIAYGASLRNRLDNEQLLGALHDGVLSAREDRFWSRLAQFSFPSYSPVRCLEVAPFSGASASEAQVDDVYSRARSAQVPLLIMLRRTSVDAPATMSALVPASAQAEHWIDQMATGRLVGTSEPFASLTQVPAAVREAEAALRMGLGWAGVVAQPRTLGAIRTDRMSLSAWLLSHVNQRQLADHITRTLAPLQGTTLLETLVTYLASGQNIARTAQVLYIHANTVRYRLARVEEAIGAPITSATALADLVLALLPELVGRVDALGRTERPG